jgi:ribosomal protein S18 acetylase RimI-like enzyme
MTREVCYLQDLFVDVMVRRQGCGAKLIEAVAAIARERGCERLYWTTKEDNATARSLYDRIARFNGFNPLRLRGGVADMLVSINQNHYLTICP